MPKDHMGTSPTKQCPLLIINDVDEDGEDLNSKPTQHSSPSKVANLANSIDEKDPSCPSQQQHICKVHYFVFFHFLKKKKLLNEVEALLHKFWSIVRCMCHVGLEEIMWIEHSNYGTC